MGTHFSREFEKNMIIIFIIYSGKIKLHFLFFLKKKPFVTTRKERKDSKSVKQILFHYMGWERDMSCPVFLHYNFYIFCTCLYHPTYLNTVLYQVCTIVTIHSTFTWDIKRRLNLCLHNNSDLKVQTK